MMIQCCNRGVGSVLGVVDLFLLMTVSVQGGVARLGLSDLKRYDSWLRNERHTEAWGSGNEIDKAKENVLI